MQPGALSSEQLWRNAQAALARNDARAAYASLLSLVRQTPAHANAHLLLGGIAHAEGRLRDATRHALDAARHVGPDAAQIASVINALLLVGEVVAARAMLAHPALASSRNAPLLAHLAGAEQMIGEHARALALLDRAIGAGLDNPDVRYLRGVQLTFNGRLDEAAAELERCLRLGPSYGRAAVTLARLRKQTAASNHLAQIDALAQRAQRGSEDHAAFEFARYKECEDLGLHDEAWSALERGNAIMAQRLRPDPQREQMRIDALIECCSTSFVEDRAEIRHEGPQPIFIVGMPRSGTTVLERILGNHTQVTSAGELGDFARQLRWAADHVTALPVDEAIFERAPRIDFAEVGRRYLAQTQWRAKGKPYFIDKLPINYLQVGFIRRALPQARILHMTRAATDVCFSNYRAFFGEGYAYSYELDALVAQYLDYRRLMRHWHNVMPGAMLDVSYDALTGDPERTARTVLDFCGLAFEPDALDIRSNATATATLSTMQVREGIRRRGGDWQPYATQLGELRQKIDNA